MPESDVSASCALTSTCGADGIPASAAAAAFPGSVIMEAGGSARSACRTRALAGTQGGKVGPRRRCSPDQGRPGTGHCERPSDAGTARTELG